VNYAAGAMVKRQNGSIQHFFLVNSAHYFLGPWGFVMFGSFFALFSLPPLICHEFTHAIVTS